MWLSSMKTIMRHLREANKECSVMNTRQAKQTVQEWVEANLEHWPGIRGAHLVGGITTMSDDALFPSYKDVDLHLIFEEGSPALSPTGPFLNLLEIPYKGL